MYCIQSDTNMSAEHFLSGLFLSMIIDVYCIAIHTLNTFFY